jgi:pseudouridine-5'-phosphate glycosidase
VADVVWAKWDMGLRGGVLVTVPVPFEEAMPADAVELAIQSALAQAEREGVRGQAVTPYLLARIVQLTGGDSLQANVALLRNNAAVAAEIAAAIAAQEAQRGTRPPGL